MIKATYTLDVNSVRQLERLARRLNTSKSGALREAIRLATTHALQPGEEEIAALDALQGSLALDARAAREWLRSVRAERRGTPRP